MDIGSSARRLLPVVGVSLGIVAFTAGTAGAVDLPRNEGTANACAQVSPNLRSLPRIALDSRNDNSFSLVDPRSSRRC